MRFAHTWSCHGNALKLKGTALIGVLLATACEVIASVTVSPATATVGVGQTVQLTATPKDANGTPLAGRVVTWTSSAPGMATVSGSGLVAGVALGSATITATSEGHSGSATVTIAAASALYPNEPPGFTVLSDQPWNLLPVNPPQASGHFWSWEYATLTYFSIVQDATAPQSPPNIGAAHVPAGWGGGIGTIHVTRTFSDVDEQGNGGFNPSQLYVSLWWKHSANWVPHPVGSKMLWPEITAYPTAFYSGFNGGNMQFIFNQQGGGGGTRNPSGVNPGNVTANAAYFAENDPTYGSWLGQWHRMEWLFVMNTAGNQDGIVRCWIDGHQIMEYTNFAWANAGDMHAFAGFTWSNTYGGLGGSAADQYEYVDHIHISGKP